jgi:Domain of unknown function in PX-proteins (DUF3818)
VQVFIDLVGRHEGSFYHFVHQVHSKGQGVFDDLMKWIEHVINFVRDGLPEPMSLEFILPHAGTERARAIEEIDSVIEYHRKLKEAHHERMRRRIVRGEMTERDEDAAFVGGMMDQFSMGDLAEVMGELDAEESDEEENDEDSSDELGSRRTSQSSDRPSQNTPKSTDTLGTALASVSIGTLNRRNAEPAPRPSPTVHTNVRGPPTPSMRASVDSSMPRKSHGRRKKGRVLIVPPTLVYIPQLVPVFVEMLRPALAQACRRPS